MSINTPPPPQFSADSRKLRIFLNQLRYYELCIFDKVSVSIFFNHIYYVLYHREIIQECYKLFNFVVMNMDIVHLYIWLEEYLG